MSISETLFTQVKEQLGAERASEWLNDATVSSAALEEACAIFPNLDASIVRQVLLETDSSVDRAIPLLFERDTQERRREHAAEKLKLMERAFAGLPPQLIQAIVKKNDGDIDTSSAELLRIMQERQEQEELALVNARKEATRQRQEQGRQARVRFLEHCVKTFDCLTRDEIAAVLSTGTGGSADSDTDVSRAVARLTELSHERKTRNLGAIFARLPRADIVRALEACAYDMQTACETLTNTSAAVAATARPEMTLKDQLDRTVHDALDAMGKPAAADAEDAQLLQSIIRRAIGPTADSPQPEQQQQQQQQQQLDLDAVASQARADGLRVTLETDTVNFPYGSSVAVRVVASGGAVSPYDWVALCTPAQPVGAYVSYQWYQPALTFALPAYGAFELRFMRKQEGAHQCLARSAALLCGPAVTLHASVSSASEWSVTWTTPAQGSEAVTSSAWIGLYEAGTAHSSFVAFKYVSLESRTLDFKAPRKNGQYEFRFFAHRFGLVAVSAALAVQKDDVVAVRREGSTLHVDVSLASVDPVERKRCWVGVFFANEERASYYRRYAWLSKSTDSFSFKTPIHAGTYEARVLDEKNRVVAKSGSFVV